VAKSASIDGLEVEIESITAARHGQLQEQQQHRRAIFAKLPVLFF